MFYSIVKVEIDVDMRNLCYQPYPGHPKRCPNYGVKASCPPRRPYFPDL